MASRYWVGGTNNWSGTVGTKWAATSGGAGGVSVPTSSDDVFFDGNSGAGVVTVQGTRTAKSLTCTGFTGTLTASHNEVDVSGDVVLGAGMSITGTLTFVLKATASITSNGKTVESMTVDVAGGTISLVDALAVSGALTLLNGTLNLSNQDSSCGNFASSNANTRTLTMGSGTITLKPNNTVDMWDVSTSTGLTLNINTSTIKVDGTGAGEQNFKGGGLTYHNIWFVRDAGGSTDYVLYGSNTFNDIKSDHDGGGQSHRLCFDPGTTQTTTTFTVTGTSSFHVGLVHRQGTIGNYALAKAGGSLINEDYLTIANCDASPANTWYAGHNSTNAGGNTGWTFGTGFLDSLTASGSPSDVVKFVVEDSIVETSAAAAVVSATTDVLILEAASGADSVAETTTWTRALTEAGAGTDSVADTLVTGVAVTESGSVADTQDASLVMWNVETLTASDAVANTATLGVALTTSGSASESISEVLIRPGALSEAGLAASTINSSITSKLESTMTAHDAVAESTAWAVAIAEATGHSDMWTATSQSGLHLAESGSISSVLAASYIFRPRLSEALVSADSVRGVWLTYTRSVEGLNAVAIQGASALRQGPLSENVGILLDEVRGSTLGILTETNPVDDQLIGGRLVSSDLTEAGLLADGLLGFRFLRSDSREFMICSDLLTKTADYLPSVEEFLALDDAQLARVSHGFGDFTVSIVPRYSIDVHFKVGG